MVEAQDQQPKVELVAPYVDTMGKEAKAKIPGHEASINTIFSEINKQAIENFGIFNSQDFPGVSFTTTKLSITPELLGKLSKSLNLTPEFMAGLSTKPEDVEGDSVSSKESTRDTRDQVWFVEPAFGAGKIGNAFSALDMGIDRFIREMPKVAYALKHGLKPPKIDIYVVGSPISLGGSVTKQWCDEVNRVGFDTHGRVYAEFVKQAVGENAGDKRVVISGPSRGSITAERTFHFYTMGMTDEEKKQVQGLYDIPAGSHERFLPLQLVKSANMALGMGAEFGVRVLFDETSKDLGKTEGKFFDELAKQKNIPQDSKAQERFKLRAFLGELKALGKGTPPDKNERGYYRAPEFDPTNIKFKGIVDRGLSLVKRRQFSFRERGRKLTVSTDRKAHNFPWKNSFGRWEQVIKYCEA